MFQAMVEAGVRPDQVSYNILIDAFGRAGLTAGTNCHLCYLPGHYSPLTVAYVGKCSVPAANNVILELLLMVLSCKPTFYV